MNHATAQPPSAGTPQKGESPWALDFAPPKVPASESDFVFNQELVEGSQQGWSSARWSQILRGAWLRQDERQLWQILQVRGLGFHTAERAAEIAVLAQDALQWATNRNAAWTPLLDILDERSDRRLTAELEAHLDRQPLASDPSAAVPELRHYRSNTLRRWIARTWGDAVPPDLLEWVVREPQARATLLARPELAAKHRDIFLTAVLRDNGQFFTPTADRPEGYRVMNTPLPELRTLAPGGLPESVHQAVHRALEGYRRAGRSGDTRTFDEWLTLLLSDPTVSADLLSALGKLLPTTEASWKASGLARHQKAIEELDQISKSDLARLAAWSQHPGWGQEDPLRWLETVRGDTVLLTWLRQILLAPSGPTSQRGQLAAPILAQLRTHAPTSPTVRRVTSGPIDVTLELEHPAMTLLSAGVLDPNHARSLVLDLRAQGGTGSRKVIAQLVGSLLASNSAEIATLLLDLLLAGTPSVAAVIPAEQLTRLLKQHSTALPAALLVRVRDSIWSSRPDAARRMALLKDLMPVLSAPSHPDASVLTEGWRAWMSSAEADQRLLAVEAMRHLRGLATPAPKRARVSSPVRRP